MIDDMNHRMHEIKKHLETLTTVELLKMADSFGIDIPPDLERIFVIQELLEANEDFAPDDENGNASDEAVYFAERQEIAPLPAQYNVNYLEILLRDPLWAFIFWEINALERKNYESSPYFKGYFLHVIPLAAFSGSTVPDSFTISVGNTDESLRIYLPSEMSLFQVRLCVTLKDRREVIASSREVSIPQALNFPDEALQNNQIYPILRLSGIEEFDILRNADKVARSHRFVG